MICLQANENLCCSFRSLGFAATGSGRYSGVVYTVPLQRWGRKEFWAEFPPDTDKPDAVAQRWWGSLAHGRLKLKSIRDKTQQQTQTQQQQQQQTPVRGWRPWVKGHGINVPLLGENIFWVTEFCLLGWLNKVLNNQLVGYQQAKGQHRHQWMMHPIMCTKLARLSPQDYLYA